MSAPDPQTDLNISMRLPAPPALVFEFITRPDRLLTWWGPEGTSLPDATLDFTRLGPWHSVIMNADGRRFKVSGRVTRVDPPRGIEFTWGWHDEADRRGPESRVRIELSPAGDGATDLHVTHRDLVDADSRSNHEMGWRSTLRKLERQFQR